MNQTGTASFLISGNPAIDDAVLQVRDLRVVFTTSEGSRTVVAGLDYSIGRGRTLGVVGESGCGKTMTALAVMGLTPNGASVTGSMQLEGKELIDLTPRQWRDVRGHSVAMVFQEPMTALNPVMPIGRQISEVLVRHENLSWQDANLRAIGLLEEVGIPAPTRRTLDYPHQLSGGMRQRAMIAIALACRPALLVADEPTTALDVTIQAQILDLMLRLQDERGMAIQFISHNLGVVSELAHDIMVMYAGRVVETAAADVLFNHPLHPYTRGLIATLPDPDHRVDRLPVIPGGVPKAIIKPGCRFAERCAVATHQCHLSEPEMREIETGHFVSCFEVRA